MDPAYVIIRIHAEPDPREENAKKKLCIGINLNVSVFQPKLRFLTCFVSANVVAILFRLRLVKMLTSA